METSSICERFYYLFIYLFIFSINYFWFTYLESLNEAELPAKRTIFKKDYEYLNSIRFRLQEYLQVVFTFFFFLFLSLLRDYRGLEMVEFFWNIFKNSYQNKGLDIWLLCYDFRVPCMKTQNNQAILYLLITRDILYLLITRAILYLLITKLFCTC